jgi:BCD family chlorophyll transporter-like MFS transporter
MMKPQLGWIGIFRLGLVQASIGAIVMLATSLLNRVMVVEYLLPALVPAALVAWHYAVQLTRPRWGHASDVGGRRTPWIIVGMGLLALGAVVATNAALLMTLSRTGGILLAVLAYAMIGGGVGAAGTSLLALLASAVVPQRRAAAAAVTWVMMIVGIVVSAAAAGQLLEPFSPARLAAVTSGITLTAFIVTLLAIARVESGVARRRTEAAPATQSFSDAISGIWNETTARRFTVFVFVSMLAYSMQDMVLEPFAGLVFGYTPGQSTSLASVQHMGVLAGMILAGIGGRAFQPGQSDGSLRPWIVGGCLASSTALAGLAFAATYGPGFPLRPGVFLLGFANGIFAVAAIAMMMELAGAGTPPREGIRMGLWGASQAIAFAIGGVIGAIGVDVGRLLLGSTPAAFLIVFAFEALLFAVAALLALRLGGVSRASQRGVSFVREGAAL